MQTVMLPYELLARFDRTGSLSGIHVQYRTMILDGDGAVLSDTLPAPEARKLSSARLWTTGPARPRSRRRRRRS